MRHNKMNNILFNVIINCNKLKHNYLYTYNMNFIIFRLNNLNKKT